MKRNEMKSQSKVGDNVFLFCFCLYFCCCYACGIRYCVINDTHIVYHFVTVSVHSNFHNFNWPPIHFDFFVTPILLLLSDVVVAVAVVSSLSPSLAFSNKTQHSRSVLFWREITHTQNNSKWKWRNEQKERVYKQIRSILAV